MALGRRRPFSSPLPPATQLFIAAQAPLAYPRHNTFDGNILMRFRLALSLAFGAALVASPVFAQQKSAKEEVKPFKIDRLVSSNKLQYAIDGSEDHDPENVLILYLSNGGRVAIRLMPRRPGILRGPGRAGRNCLTWRLNSTMCRMGVGLCRWRGRMRPIRRTVSFLSCFIRGLRLTGNTPISAG